MKENKETLIKFADTYFWDVFAIVTTGFILFIEIDYFTKIEKTDLLNWVTYFFLFYALGLMGDGLLGFFPLTKILKLVFKNSHEACEQELIKDVREKDIFNKKISDRELVTQVRIYLEIHHVSHRYLSFFSKNRFYYNVSVIALFNGFFFWIVYFFPNVFTHSINFLTTLIISILSLFLCVCLWKLANKFWFYSCNELYSKFLLFIKNK